MMAVVLIRRNFGIAVVVHVSVSLLPACRTSWLPGLSVFNAWYVCLDLVDM